MPKASGSKGSSLTIVTTVMLSAMIATLPVGQAYSACFFCKGGSLSIDKPFDTPFAKAIGKAATDVWDAVKRPFVETAKFLRDPYAGLKRMADDWLNRIGDIPKGPIDTLVKWFMIGIAALIGSALMLVFMLAALIVRLSRPVPMSGPKIKAA